MKLKTAVIGFAYFSGLLTAFLLRESFIINLVITVVSGVLGLFLALNNRRSIGVFCGVFGIAFGVFTVYKVVYIDSAQSLDGLSREVTGTVLSKTSPAHDMAGYIIEADVDGVLTRFSIYTLDIGAEVGDLLTVEVKFSLLQDNTAFMEASYYMSDGVFLKGTAISTPVHIPAQHESFSPLSLPSRFNEYLKNQILTSFPNDIGGLITAMFLGDRSGLSNSLSDSIQRAGIAHYASVSGLHLSLITHLFISLMNLTRLKVMRRLRFVLLTILTLSFMFFFNLSPSVLRAGTMLIIYYGGDLFMRRGNTLNSVGFALLVIILPTPHAALDAGLQLSVAGLLGVGVIAPAVNKLITGIRLKNLRETFLVNLCANWATLPLVAIYFNGVSLASALTSILLLPLFTVLLVSMLVFAGTVTLGLGGLPLFIAGIAAKLIEWIADFFSDFKFAYIPMDYGFVIYWVFFSAVLITLTGLNYKSISSTVKAASLSLFALAMMIITTEYLRLHRTYLDIYTDGTSACVFLRYKNHSAVIVTDDGIRASYAVRDFVNNNYLDEVGLLLVINSTNNSISYFESLPSLLFVPPGEAVHTYDVSGLFTVTIEDSAVLIDTGEIIISIGHAAAMQSSDINITYSHSVNPGATGGLVLHTSRRQNAEQLNQRNAYYEKVRFII